MKPTRRICCQLTQATSYSLGVLLLWSSWHHLANPWAFLVTVSRYDMVDARLTQIVAMVLPSFQFSLGVMMCANTFRRTTAAMTFTLMLLYSLAQVQALARGLSINCGCFASSGDKLSIFTVARTVCFAIAASAVLVVAVNEERYHATVSKS